MKKSAIAVLAGVLISGHVLADDAQPKAYLGLNYLAAQYEEDGVDDTLDVGAIFVQLGAQINPYLAGELRVGSGITDDSTTIYGVDASLEIKNLFGGYLKAGIPTGTLVYPYVVAGVSRAEVEVTASSGYYQVSNSDSGSDISYGAGVNLDIADNFAANVEYMQYYDKDGIDISGISFGGQFKF
ncbi:porin family protein [Marinobacter halodurans]|uniref:Porin family protein n=1 Tax=Marinobacter halodurans TaxID=2528979 RepID=A0ABY1ZGT2_9GAMM|nr:porin family protein [Marinobacter halodurans]TBW50777.1 porin family protein [Marinobacter halodurans]